MFKHILVQLDPSRPLNHAPALARRLAQRFDADLTALYVVDEEVSHLIGSDLIRAMDTALAAVGRDALDAFEDQVDDYADEVGGPIRLNKAIGYGQTPEVIARYAMKHAVDLIVTGGFHSSVYTRVPFGSVVNEIIRRSPCSVMLARDQHPDPLRSGDIVLAYDGSPASKRALHVSAAFANAHDQGLEVAHVGRGPFRADAKADKVLADVEEQREKLPVALTTRSLRPTTFHGKAHAIMSHARSIDARLIALAVRGENRTGPSGTSPTVEKLVIHTDRPLLVIHP